MATSIALTTILLSAGLAKGQKTFNVDAHVSRSAADLQGQEEIEIPWSADFVSETDAIAVGAASLSADSTVVQSSETDSATSAEAQANNPLANFTAVNFQNYYIGDLTGPAADANQFVLRVAQPVAKGGWLVRASLPVNTFPISSTNLNTRTGLGDLNVFAAGLIDIGNPAMSFGIGPQMTFPTATETNTGSDKWSIGIANVLFDARSPKVQYGYLLTYQHSFAGNPDRPDVNGAAFQPFGFLQLGNAWYLRTAPIWAFNFENSDFNIPLGLGIGKVIKSRKTTYNFFIEPQYTVAYSGNNQPQWQIYFALNMQFKN